MPKYLAHDSLNFIATGGNCNCYNYDIRLFIPFSKYSSNILIHFLYTTYILYQTSMITYQQALWLKKTIEFFCFLEVKKSYI